MSKVLDSSYAGIVFWSKEFVNFFKRYLNLITMRFVLETLLNAGVLLGIAYFWPKVHIKNYAFAIVVALILGILNSTIGFLIRVPLNFLTLGMLTFIIRMLVTAFLLKIIDKFTDDLTIDGYLPAIVIAVAMALASSIL